MRIWDEAVVVRAMIKRRSGTGKPKRSKQKAR
jgi:hypothetical protein